MGLQSQVSVALTSCKIPTREEAIASVIGPCDVLAFNWLHLFTPAGVTMNPTQQRLFDEFEGRIAKHITDTYQNCVDGKLPSVTPPSTEPKLTVKLQTGGVSGGVSGGVMSNLGMFSRVDVSFSPPQPPEVCSPYPYTLIHNVLRGFTNNRCAEVTLSVQGSAPGTTNYTTGTQIAQSVLGFTVSMDSQRVANLGVIFEVQSNPPVPAGLVLRVEAFDESRVSYDLAPLSTPYPQGWDIYVEVCLRDTGDVWWCGWGIPFKQPWPHNTSTDQGAEQQSIDAYSLFSTHPGEVMSLLNGWVDSVGSDGTWDGRVVLGDSRVYPTAGDVTYGGDLIAEGIIFPAAPFYLAHVAYVPGVSSGIPLTPRLIGGSVLG